MSRISSLVLFAQLLLAGCAVAMAFMIEMPWLGIAGLMISGASALATGFFSKMPVKAATFAWRAGGAGILLIPTGFLFSNRAQTWDNYYAVMAWLIAAAIFIAAFRMADATLKLKWKGLGLAWGFLGSFAWLAASYAQNLTGGFYVGLVSGVVGLMLCRAWFQPGAFGIQAVNTLILLCIGLPIADLAMRHHARADMRAEPEKYYSYEAAKLHPTAYADWTRYYEEQWARMSKDILEPVPEREPPFRLRPGSRGFLLQSPISINRLGFRGAEISEDKGNAYRIVALGESTTFGCTLTAADRPWPELLEQMIRERLETSRPVQVINAGTPAYSLASNLQRMTSDILPLKPDMIISYHGLNGFPMIDTGMAPAYGKPPPVYRERPLKLLGDLEYGIRLLQYKRRLTAAVAPPATTNVEPGKTKYADAYRRLIQIARTNHIQLVLANYSMAVNADSDPDIIRFYRQTYPAVNRDIKANEIHSRIVREMADQNPEICFIDTHSNMDGEHGKYIDLVHFAPSGRQQMAETIFAGIQKILVQDLASR